MTIAKQKKWTRETATTTPMTFPRRMKTKEKKNWLHNSSCSSWLTRTELVSEWMAWETVICQTVNVLYTLVAWRYTFLWKTFYDITSWVAINSSFNVKSSAKCNAERGDPFAKWKRILSWSSTECGAHKITHHSVETSVRLMIANEVVSFNFSLDSNFPSSLSLSLALRERIERMFCICHWAR